MKIFSYVPSIACAIAGGILCYYQREGWGWFLFASLILYPTWYPTKEDEE